MVDMETGQRGFMLTGDEEFLDPFHEGMATFLDLVADTKELVRDNPPQVSRLSTIELLFNQWVSTAGLFEVESFWRHSLGVGVAAKIVAAEAFPKDSGSPAEALAKAGA